MTCVICSLKVYVYKPATSKSGNSEVYVVCLNFHGLQERKEEFIKFCKPFFGEFKHRYLIGIHVCEICILYKFTNKYILN